MKQEVDWSRSLLQLREIKNVEIDESILIPSEKQVIEDLLLAAIKDCKVKSEEASKKEMNKMGQAFGLPEGFKLPF